MADDAKKPGFFSDVFPNLLKLVAQLWIIVSVGALVMVLTVWVFIFVQNIGVFKNVMDTYMGNSKSRYDMMDLNPGSGYVAGTNMPKHLGGAVFASLFAVAMWFFIAFALAADLAWRYPRALEVLRQFRTIGISPDSDKPYTKMYAAAANYCLKLFIAVATGSTSFYDLQPNNPDVDTPLFCVYAVFILIGSGFITMACQWLMTSDTYDAALADVEKAATAKGEAAGAAAAMEKMKKEKEKEKAKAKAKS